MKNHYIIAGKTKDGVTTFSKNGGRAAYVITGGKYVVAEMGGFVIGLGMAKNYNHKELCKNHLTQYKISLI